MVRTGQVDAACVPLENSVEGAVALTHDELTHGDPLLITAEAYVPVTFQLLARPGTSRPDVRTVGSHPHGLAQVRDWLARELPQAGTVVTDSTASAASAVADGTLDAAAAAPVAGRRYGLAVLADDIGLHSDAITRFVLLRRPAPPPARTGNDRTSMVLWVANEPGTLLGLLTEFAGRGINLTRLESRPTRTTMGEYVFLVDADGHVTDPAMADVLAALLRRGALLRYLGSYPRRRGTSVPPAEFASRDRYDSAAAAVTQLQQGVL
jgi:prephenate dehydratase